jgi:hypothetical protein
VKNETMHLNKPYDCGRWCSSTIWSWHLYKMKVENFSNYTHTIKINFQWIVTWSSTFVFSLQKCASIRQAILSRIISN